MEKSKDSTLKPLSINRRYEDLISDELYQLLKSEIFEPLKLVLLKNETIKNSVDALLEAIRSGRITFSAGQFNGKRNSAISKGLKDIGAKFDRKTKSYKLPKQKLPQPVASAVQTSKANIARRLTNIDRVLTKIDPEKIGAKVALMSIYQPFLKDVASRFEDNVGGLKIDKKLTSKQMENIAKRYNDNMSLYIKEWTEKQIKDFREVVQENVKTGLRYEELQEKILKKGLTTNRKKARFWARQETNLLNSEYQIEQFQEIGVKKYIWTTVNGSAEHPVRERHKELSGKVISLDKPPIVDYKTGRRAHAGQDFNCRCRMKPIISA